MKRAGRFLAALAMALTFAFVIGTLGSAGGCSGSSGTTGGLATRNEVADKEGQDKMREFMKNKPGSTNKTFKRR
jgi:hypothetical protein